MQFSYANCGFPDSWGHLIGGRSSSAAKNALAAFKISLGPAQLLVLAFQLDDPLLLGGGHPGR
jgi:hypothetical protein